MRIPPYGGKTVYTPDESSRSRGGDHTSAPGPTTFLPGRSAAQAVGTQGKEGVLADSPLEVVPPRTHLLSESKLDNCIKQGRIVGSAAFLSIRRK